MPWRQTTLAKVALCSSPQCSKHHFESKNPFSEQWNCPLGAQCKIAAAEGRTSNLQLCVQCEEQRKQNSLFTVCFWTSISCVHPYMHINACVLDFDFLSTVITSCPCVPQIFLQVKLTHCQDWFNLSLKTSSDSDSVGSWSNVFSFWWL